MLLGKYGGPHQTSVLRILLDDDEVSGQAVYAIRLLAPAGLEEEIRPFLSHEKAWIRNEARQYLDKVAKKN